MMEALKSLLTDAWLGMIIMYEAGALNRAIVLAAIVGSSLLGYLAGRAGRIAEEQEDEDEWLEIIRQ